MEIVTENPFEAIEYELKPVKLKKDDKEIEVRHFHVRFIVGETDFKHYVGKELPIITHEPPIKEVNHDTPWRILRCCSTHG